MSLPIRLCLALAVLASPAFSQRPQLVRPTNVHAIQIAPLDAQAVAFSATLAPRLTPTARSWIHSEALALAAQQLGDAAMVGLLRRDATARFANQGAKPADIDVLVELILFECAQDADTDLRGQMAQMEAANARSRAMTQEEMMLRLQALMQKKSQYQLVLSNMMKASRSTSDATFLYNLK